MPIGRIEHRLHSWTYTVHFTKRDIWANRHNHVTVNLFILHSTVRNHEEPNRTLRSLHLLDVLVFRQFRDSNFGWNKKIFPSPKYPSRFSVQPASCSVSPGAKRHKRQAEYTFSYNVEMKRVWSYTSNPTTCLYYLWGFGSNFASDVEDQNICGPPKI